MSRQIKDGSLQAVRLKIDIRGNERSDNQELNEPRQDKRVADTQDWNPFPMHLGSTSKS
jgi:hypothetical protein